METYFFIIGIFDDKLNRVGVLGSYRTVIQLVQFLRVIRYNSIFDTSNQGIVQHKNSEFFAVRYVFDVFWYAEWKVMWSDKLRVHFGMQPDYNLGPEDSPHQICNLIDYALITVQLLLYIEYTRTVLLPKFEEN